MFYQRFILLTSVFAVLSHAGQASAQVTEAPDGDPADLGVYDLGETEPPHEAVDDTIQEDMTEQVVVSKKKHYLSLSVENDSIGGGTDHFYTSGVRLTYFNVNAPVPKAMDAD